MIRMNTIRNAHNSIETLRSANAAAELCVRGWWFGYGYYFSQEPGRP